MHIEDSGGGDSCQRCHVGDSGPAVGASLSITGEPEMYEPGRRYTITVELERGLGPQPHFDVLHAFRLSVTDGALETSDPDLVVDDLGVVGSRVATDRTRWAVVWTAPDSHEEVVFSAEAVMADGDGTEEGDVTMEALARSSAPLDVPPD